MKNHVIVGVLLAVVGGTAASASTIRTRSAVYGDLAGKQVCDATSAVAGLCDGRSRCLVRSSNALCGDPTFLTVKAVRVDYTCGRRPRSAVAPEYKSLSIECR